MIWQLYKEEIQNSQVDKIINANGVKIWEANISTNCQFLLQT